MTRRAERSAVVSRWEMLVGLSIVLGIFLGILIDIQKQNNILIYKAEAKELVATSTPEVLVRVQIEWTRERIIEQIRTTFPEAPNTAVAIFKCESGLKADIQSHHILSYGREESFGVSQIHAKDWDARAMKLGFVNYKTDPGDNLKMARYIYDGRGNFKDWSCYNNGGYKRFL